MESDEEPSVAWIDYVIASEDPADKALADAFLAQSWAHSQTMQWIMRETESGKLTEAMMEKLGEEMEQSRALQERIHYRARQLAEAGAAPADATTAAAWHAQRISLSPTLASDDDPIYRA
jgi:5-enolpyruvylshikimate-3-phosphate synthase